MSAGCRRRGVGTFGTVPRRCRAARSNVLLGRSLEVEQIDRLIAEVLAGRGGQLLVVGAPGIGKTQIFDMVVPCCHRDRFLRYL